MPTADPDSVTLLAAPYPQPPQSVGARAICLVRDVRVTCWTDACVPWPGQSARYPRCNAVISAKPTPA